MKSGPGRVKRIVTSGEFLERLTKCADVGKYAGHEAGFSVFEDDGGRIIYGGVICGDWASVRGAKMDSAEVAGISSADFVRNDVYIPVTFHMHSCQVGFMPSETDISSFLNERKSLLDEKESHYTIRCRPVCMIGSMPSMSGDFIEVLVMQETGRKALGEKYTPLLYSGIVNSREGMDDNRSIANALNKQRGVRADILTYAGRRNCGMYSLNESEAKKLKKFEFKPVWRKL
jgi:hypothetical protein